VSATELVTLATCDLGAIVRGRAIFAEDLPDHLDSGIGWVPANQALTPLGGLAAGEPFGSTGDLRLRPVPEARLRIEPSERTPERGALDLVLCDIVELDGRPWEACTRALLRTTLERLQRDFGAHAHVAFEHEFQILDAGPPLPGFSLRAQRAAEPFGSELMGALRDARLGPERFFAEFASHQFELPLAPTQALSAADRAVLFRETVHEVAGRSGASCTFVPLLDPAEAGNGVHVHLSLEDDRGAPLLYDVSRPGTLSELGGSFAAGILAHARALTALTAPSPVSAARLGPHHWSAGAVALGLRNRETLLRIPPIVPLVDRPAAQQMHLEFRACDAAANPYLALAAVLSAGMEGMRAGLEAPPVLDRDPATLDAEDAKRFAVGALPGDLGESLRALEDDEAALAWLPPALRDAYLAVKRSEIAAAEGEDLPDTCRRYAGIY
jgi:glutamine synthetase